MSNNESFIDEVTEEVRRDRVFAYIRKYGWIAALGVVGLVGAAGWMEYTATKTENEARAAGDALYAALEQNDWTARQSALAALPPTVANLLLLADAAQEAGDAETAISTYTQLAVLEEAPAIYKQLASFKALLLNAENMSPAERIDAFQAQAIPGAPFATLAQEQVAIAQIAAGETDAALATLKTLSEDPLASQGLRNRVQTLIVALGGEVSQ